MSKYGKQLKINAILLVGITTLIPRIFSLDNYNLRNQRYDYIDLAKATAGSRSKGQTTRIFTTDDELDEKFWLKYLGEDFRHAVHLQVDGQSNVIPLVKVKSPTLPTLKYNRKANKRLRFARQPTQQENDKQLPVEEDLVEHSGNENQYPTEKPELFNVYLSSSTTTSTTTTTTTPTPANCRSNQQQHFNNKNPVRHNKDNLLLPNKYNKQKLVKMESRRMHKAINEPIVVHLPETEDAVHTTDKEHVPVPPLIYQQNAELYRQNKSNRQFLIHNNQLYVEQIPNLNANNQNMDFQYQPLQLNTQNLYPQDSTSYTALSHQTHFPSARNTRQQHKRQQQQQQHQQHLVSPTQYTTYKHFKQIYP